MTPLIRTVLFFIAGEAIASLSATLNPLPIPQAIQTESLWPALVGICVITYPLIDYHALVHAAKIKNGINIIHWKAFLLRAAVTFALCCLIHVYWFNMIKVVDLTIYAAGWVGIVFNLRVNRYRGKSRFYVGAPDRKHDSLEEKIFRRWKYGGQLLFGMEVVWMLVWGYVYVQ
jgi:hypothetical protein